MFEVSLKKSAEKFIFQLDKKRRTRILNIIRYLEKDPIPFRRYNVAKLKGYKNRFRIRVGKIRIVYEFFPEKFKVIIWDIDFRERIY